jgi:hypothetical protein
MHASFLPSLKDLGRMIAASSEVKLRPTRHAFQTTGSLSLSPIDVPVVAADDDADADAFRHRRQCLIDRELSG